MEGSAEVAVGCDFSFRDLSDEGPEVVEDLRAIDGLDCSIFDCWIARRQINAINAIQGDPSLLIASIAPIGPSRTIGNQKY